MPKTKDVFKGSDLKTDLSPMIDLVFLLLIFFMVTANLVTFKKDPRVVVPVASDAVVPELIEGRVVMNVLQDGSIVDTEGKVMSTSELEQFMSQAKAKNAKTRLHLRADARSFSRPTLLNNPCQSCRRKVTPLRISRSRRLTFLR